MKIFIIILFLFLFFIIMFTASICIDVEKLEIDDGKIKYKANIEVYILRVFKVFKKKIQKKDLLRIVNLIRK